MSIQITMTDRNGKQFASKIDLPRGIDFEEAKSVVEAHWWGLAGDLRRCDGWAAEATPLTPQSRDNAR